MSFPTSKSTVRALPWTSTRPAKAVPFPLHLNFSGQTRVLAVDANVMIRELRRKVRQPEETSALMALLGTPHARVVMSWMDVAPPPPGGAGIPATARTRIEASIQRAYRNAPELAQAMVREWRETVAPNVIFLNPAGLPDTPRSASARTPERDPDDADLLLLADALGADLLLSDDAEAFAGLVPVASKGQYGHVVRAHHDALQADEAAATLVGFPVRMVAHAGADLSQWFSARGVTPAAQVVVAAGGLALMLWHPPARKWVSRRLMEYWAFAERFQPSAEQLAGMEGVTLPMRLPLEQPSTVIVLVLRHLARSGAMSSSDLVRVLGLRLSAGALTTELSRYPGLLARGQYGRWQLRPPGLTSAPE